jgi:hypothetical protein
MLQRPCCVFVYVVAKKRGSCGVWGTWPCRGRACCLMRGSSACRPPNHGCTRVSMCLCHCAHRCGRAATGASGPSACAALRRAGATSRRTRRYRVRTFTESAVLLALHIPTAWLPSPDVERVTDACMCACVRVCGCAVAQDTTYSQRGGVVGSWRVNKRDDGEHSEVCVCVCMCLFACACSRVCAWLRVCVSHVTRAASVAHTAHVWCSPIPLCTPPCHTQGLLSRRIRVFKSQLMRYVEVRLFPQTHVRPSTTDHTHVPTSSPLAFGALLKQLLEMHRLKRRGVSDFSFDLCPCVHVCVLCVCVHLRAVCVRLRACCMRVCVCNRARWTTTTPTRACTRSTTPTAARRGACVCMCVCLYVCVRVCALR